MAGFVFPLERVLRYREGVEKKQLKLLSLKKSALLEIEEMIDNEINKLKDFTRRINFRSGVFSSEEFLSCYNYIFRLEKRIEQLKLEKAIKEEEFNRALEKLNEARKKRLAIEKLKDRQYQKYIENLKRTEEKELDDINQKIYLNKEKLTIEDLPIEET